MTIYIFVRISLPSFSDCWSIVSISDSLGNWHSPIRALLVSPTLYQFVFTPVSIAVAVAAESATCLSQRYVYKLSKKWKGFIFGVHAEVNFFFLPGTGDELKIGMEVQSQRNYLTWFKSLNLWKINEGGGDILFFLYFYSFFFNNEFSNTWPTFDRPTFGNFSNSKTLSSPCLPLSWPP